MDRLDKLKVLALQLNVRLTESNNAYEESKDLTGEYKDYFNIVNSFRLQNYAAIELKKILLRFSVLVETAKRQEKKTTKSTFNKMIDKAEKAIKESIGLNN